MVKKSTGRLSSRKHRYRNKPRRKSSTTLNSNLIPVHVKSQDDKPQNVSQDDADVLLHFAFNCQKEPSPRNLVSTHDDIPPPSHLPSSNQDLLRSCHSSPRQEAEGQSEETLECVDFPSENGSQHDMDCSSPLPNLITPTKCELLSEDSYSQAKETSSEEPQTKKTSISFLKGGFLNKGNTCFLGSTLKLLLHIPLLSPKLKILEKHGGKCSEDKGCLDCALFRLCQIHDESKVDTPVDPSSFIEELKSHSSKINLFLDGSQKDAHEFLLTVLDSLHQDISYDLYGWAQFEQKTCSVCGKERSRPPYPMTHIQVKPNASLQNSVQEYFMCNGDEDEVQCFCDVCEHNTSQKKKFSFVAPGDFLVVNVKRFTADGKKDSAMMNIDKTLCVSTHSYTLKGYVSHIGASGSNGHYIVNLKVGEHDKEDVWNSYNDSHVTHRIIQEEDIINDFGNGYLFLYERTSQYIQQAAGDFKAPNAKATPKNSSKATILKATPKNSPKPSQSTPKRTPVSSKRSSEKLAAPLHITPTLKPKPKELICIPRGKCHHKKTEVAVNSLFASGRAVCRFLQAALVCVLLYFQEEAYLGHTRISLKRPSQRVAHIFGTSVATVSKYFNKWKRRSPLKTPNAQRPHRKKPKGHIDGFTAQAIQNLCYEYVRKGKWLTLKILLTEIRKRKIEFFGSISTLRLVMKRLGFKYSRVNGRRYLKEKSTIVSKRISFLRQYMALKDKYPIVWLDETWIFRKGGMKHKAWQDVDLKSCPVKSLSGGKRYIVLHAGGAEGFVDGAELLFASKSNSADYHGEMNSRNFMEWWREKFLPKLTRPTLIIMDNAPYHSAQLDPQPSSRWKKNDLLRWLRERNIECDEKMLHPELYNLARMNRDPPTYIADEEAKRRGHIVLRLPPYHCEYNPIELVWGQMKSYYDKHIGENNDFSEEAMLRVWYEAINKVTPKNWADTVEHVDKMIESAWINELGRDRENYDKTDYSKLQFTLSSDEEYEGLLDSDDEDDDDYNDEEKIDNPKQVKIEVRGAIGKQEGMNVPSKSQNTKRKLFPEADSKNPMETVESIGKDDLVVDLAAAGVTKTAPEGTVVDVTTKDDTKTADDVAVIDLTSEDDNKQESQSADAQPVVSKFKIEIRERDLDTLKPDTCLNDQIINMYTKLLEERSFHEGPSVFTFPTFFYLRFCTSSYSFVKCYTNKVNIFDKDIVLVPIHHPSAIEQLQHWSLIVIDIRRKKLLLYDSLESVDRRPFKIVLDYLSKEATERKYSNFDSSQWKKVTMTDIPKQSNSTDCGVFLCWYADLVCTDTAVSFDVDPDSVTKRRQLMILQIKELSLTPDNPYAYPPTKQKKKGKDAVPARKRPRNTSKRPIFRKAVESDVPTTTDGVVLITSAHVHQRSDHFTEAGNDFCSILAAMAIAWKASVPSNLTTDVLDDIIFAGFQLSLNRKSNSCVFSDNEPLHLEAAGKSVVMVSTSCAVGSYGLGRYLLLEDLVLSAVRKAKDGLVSFILCGNSRSVSFWTDDHVRYYLFNPHCVDKNNNVCTSAKKGAARFFKCFSLKALCNVIFRCDVYDATTWKLYVASLQ